MALDQLTFMLYPPQWMQRSTEDRGMRYVFGGFVRSVAAVPKTDADRPNVRLDALCDWLEGRGFVPDHREATGAIYGNGRILLPDGPRHDIEVNAHAVAGEVSSVRCRFVLAPDAPARLERWELFVYQLCAAFRLRIAVRNDEAVGPEAFVGLVRGEDNWRFFAEEYGWPAPWEEA